MSKKVIIGVLLCLSTGLVKGQLGASLLGDDVYIYPRVKLAYNETEFECRKYNAVPANLNNETVRNGTLAARTGNTNDEVWNFNNTRNMTSDLCSIINLMTGEISELNCSEARPFVCVGAAWKNVTQRNGDKFGFSNVKLRYTDARRVCGEKGTILQLPGNLAFVTSSELQNFLSTFTMSSDVGYWMNRTHQGPNISSSYENWVENRTAVAEQDSCVQMKPDGKWDNVICHDHIRFICEWKSVVATTTETAHMTKPGKEMSTTGTFTTTTTTTTMPPKMVTTKSATTKAMEYTTMMSTSGSAITKSSVTITITIAIASIYMFLA